MFNTEMHFVTFSIIVIQCLFLFWGLIALIARPKDLSRERFVWLVSTFLMYNIFGGLFPDKAMGLHLLVQNTLAYGSGMILPTYYFWYLMKELDFDLGKLFNPKVLLIILLFLFIVTYIPIYLVSSDFNLARYYFIFVPVLLALILFYKIVQALYIKSKLPQAFGYYKTIFICGYLGIGFIACLPIITMIGDFQVLEVSIVNGGFLTMAYAQIIRYVHISRMELSMILNSEVGEEKEKEVINVIENFHEKLTSREIELLPYIADRNLTYKDIGEKTAIHAKTMSKHASNIFRKLDINDRKSFIQQFSKHYVVE
ncbi:MAG: helix-turn-helix domain-containing protein [Flavobacteriales bacterium]|jgi:DNA-binding CsgD family transcriptional regulator